MIPRLKTRTRIVVPRECGYFIYPPQVTVEKNIEIRAKYALLLNEALERRYILGDAVEGYYQTFRSFGEISEAQAQEALAKLEAWVHELEATQNEPVALHGEADQRYAGFAFQYMRPEDYRQMGIAEPADPGTFTRLEARKAVVYLHEKLQGAA